MSLLKFILLLNSKPSKQKLMWLDILATIELGYISISAITSNHAIPKSSFYRLFKSINQDIKINGILYSFYLKDSKVYSKALDIENTISSDENKVVKKVKKIQSKNNLELVKNIIEHLNMQSGKDFKINSATSIKFINARLKDGYVLEDFKKVIDTKCTKWLNTSMSEYLRPQTLFSNKFEGYVNETVTVKKDRIDRLYDTIKDAGKFN